MINSHHASSSVASTEDGSSSTFTGGHPHQRPSWQEERPQYLRQQSQRQEPHSHSRDAGVRSPSLRARHDYPCETHAQRRDTRCDGGDGGAAASLRERESRSQRRYIEAVEEGAPPLHGGRTARVNASALASPKPAAEEPQALLESVVLVSTRMPPHEPQVRPLGVYVRTGRGGPNGVTRVVLIRLTDPADPFFLFELELLEDDYGTFKQRLELLVDFHGFPRYLVGMLRDIADGTSAYELSFVLNTATSADASRGTLRVLETTDFKTVEHISLVLLRQGDAGLKRYLAERFQHYEQSYRAAEASRVATTADLQAKVEELHTTVETLRERLREAEEQRRFMSTDAEKEQLAALNRLRDQHAKEMNSIRAACDKKVEQLTHAADDAARQLRLSTSEHDTATAELRAHAASLEASVTTLQSQLRSAHDTAGVQARELSTLREMNEELANFKAEATKAMSENELNYVTLTERLRGTSTVLHSREEKVAALQAHYEKQDEYIRILAEQNKQQADRVREAEKNLDKAHHIITNQLQAIKNVKDRYRIAADQLRSQEALLQERDGSMRRLQEEAAAATERVHELLRKNNDLREQLETTNNTREQLVQEVKLSQQALLRLQQTTSINGRHWGVLSSAYGGRDVGARAGSAMDAAPGGGATDLMREFGANAHVVGQSGHRGLYTTSASSADHRSLNTGNAAAAERAPSMTAPLPAAQAAASGAAVPRRPSLFAEKATSASPAHSSQDRAGSAETAGLTEPHGRASTSSLGRTEPAAVGPAAASARLTTLAPRAAHAPRSSFNDLAVKSFFAAGDDVAERASSRTAPVVESAYF
ncbi:hypothetical protein NESM_000144600 [Novymonas esmeraldas]|uniref:Spindle assembly abnormal protein 6 N-terminal domain-containing protein n=1 Tax=Novymonas esmeraldas TaxID=1808958 RepID=A0AAW0F2Q5_9TRYP